jgi:NAD dependent epimerase/dehydratase family enzyme
VPAAAARLIFGEMGDALLLASTRVVPSRAETTGFSFLFPDLTGALKAELGRG